MSSNKNILEYWEDEKVESMYDKHLLNAEISMIKKEINFNSKILDAGCGEGEGTLAYSLVKGVNIEAVDFSKTRLQKASERLKGNINIQLKHIDFLGNYNLAKDYDIIISQRFLINLTNWSQHKKVILDLLSLLKPEGKLIMLEGSKQGVDSLNEFRLVWGMEPINIKWHNFFFDDKKLSDFLYLNKYKLINHDGFGSYFLLTRGIRPLLEKDLNWDNRFNFLASIQKTREMIGIDETKFSRVKFWVFQKI